MDACKPTNSVYESDVFYARLNKSSAMQSVRWKISVIPSWRILEMDAPRNGCKTILHQVDDILLKSCGGVKASGVCV